MGYSSGDLLMRPTAKVTLFLVLIGKRETIVNNAAPSLEQQVSQSKNNIVLRDNQRRRNTVIHHVSVLGGIQKGDEQTEKISKRIENALNFTEPLTIKRHNSG